MHQANHEYGLGCLLARYFMKRSVGVLLAEVRPAYNGVGGKRGQAHALHAILQLCSGVVHNVLFVEKNKEVGCEVRKRPLLLNDLVIVSSAISLHDSAKCLPFDRLVAKPDVDAVGEFL